MENRTDILNELKTISPLLAGMEKVNVFTVPAGYFEDLSDYVFMSILGNGGGILNTISRKDPARVPDGYFEKLADSILNRIRKEQSDTAADELKTLSPMLYSIQDVPVYAVPEDYFNGLANNILHKIQVRKSSLSVVSRTSAVFMRYAVAAVFTGAMALGVFKFSSSPISKNGDTAWSMNVDKELDKVSDDDMIKYLENNGENVDAITVASKTLDENDLPSQSDYLNDDKALDNYLDNVNTNNSKN